jgi:hypothetical protein
MTLSFYSLFSSCAKYIQRYFASVVEDDFDYCYFTESFHEVFLCALGDFGDCLKDNNLSCGDLTGPQITCLIPVLTAAYQEVVKDAELNSEIRSCYYPGYFLRLDTGLLEEKKKQLKSYLELCCPIAEVDYAET